MEKPTKSSVPFERQREATQALDETFHGFLTRSTMGLSPIALALAKRGGLSKAAILLAMVGGGKAGNIMSPNPNAIAAADAFDIPLTSVMAAGIVPALFGVVVTYFLAKRLVKKGSMVEDSEVETEHHSKLPHFAAAISAPLVSVEAIAPGASSMRSV